MVKKDLVFIIDDDVILNEVHALLLSKLYPEIIVETFTTASEAIEAIDKQKLPDTVFLDLHIPGERDTYFLDEHKTRSLTSDIYLMSALTYMNNPELLTTYPAIIEFISKPLLDHKIKHVFNHYA